MSIFDKLTKLATKRVSNFGAQYTLFALYIIINYPIAYLYGAYVNYGSHYPHLMLRFVSIILCLPLLFNKSLPDKLKSLLPLYWYLTLIFTIPLMTFYMLMDREFSLGWIINFNIGVMLMILLVDWVMFLILELIGIVLGVLLFMVLHDSIPSLPDSEITTLFFYMYFWIAVTGTIFSRNKEQFNINNLKTRDLINKELEGQVAKRTKELTKALAVKTEFLNNISHEIRTPIGAFSMLSEGLVNNWNSFDNEKRYATANMIAGTAKRIRNLSMHLIAATKLQDSSSSLSLQRLDLAQLIKDFIDEAESLYTEKKGIKIKFSHPTGQDFYINADRESIDQVIRNIILNSIKFSPAKSTITIGIEKYQGEVKVTISDEGVGIPIAEIEQIFTPFYQSTRTKTGAGGVGLGLNISKQIVEAHKGKIWAINNEKSAGSSFIFTLKEHKEVKKSSEAKIKHGLILAVDDERPMLDSIELAVMSRQNLELITADSGKDGLDILKARHQEIDLVLLDIMMPGFDGIEVLKVIRERWPHIKIIMQSGTSDQGAKDTCLKLGATAFIAKPYQIADLLKVIDQELI